MLRIYSCTSLSLLEEMGKAEGSQEPRGTVGAVPRGERDLYCCASFFFFSLAAHLESTAWCNFVRIVSGNS